MKSMTISKKLYAAFGVLFVATLIMGAVAIWNVTTLGASIDDLGHNGAKIQYLAGDVNNLTSDMLACSRGIMVRTFTKDPAKVREYKARFDDKVSRAKREEAELLGTAKDPQVRSISQSRVADKLDAVAQANQELFDSASKGDVNEMIAVYKDKLLPVLSGVSDSADEASQREHQVLATRADEDTAPVAPARYTSIFLILITIVCGIVTVYIVRGISRSLLECFAELREGADQVANAASQVSSSSQSLAQGASEQAASLEETSASSEEINSMARKNTDNSRTTAQLLAQSMEKVQMANHHLGEMVSSMNDINESSGKISRIIKVIDEIAFQTNILALNAAVEAARAGEAGMGFAVVADEVRSLAQRSAQAAKDTAMLIEDSIAKSSEGKGKVDQVAAAIHTITEDSSRIKVMVDEVSLGSEEQSRGIEQISKAITQMEQVTQTSAASAEEGAASAEELNAQSETLKDIVSRLHRMVESNGHEEHRSVAEISRRPLAVRRPPVPNFRTQPVTPVAARDSFPMQENFQSF